VATNKVNVIAIVSFEGVRMGDVAAVDMTPRLEALIASGYLKVTGELEGYDGSFEAGPYGDPQSIAISGSDRGHERVADRSEPSEGARSSRHRKTPSVDS